MDLLHESVRVQLLKREYMIERGYDALLKALLALMEIRSCGYYSETYTGYPEYVEERFNNLPGWGPVAPAAFEAFKSLFLEVDRYYDDFKKWGIWPEDGYEDEVHPQGLPQDSE